MITHPTYIYDIAAIREDFPILHQYHHDAVPLIYLDSAASSQKPYQVIEAIQHYYQTYNANVHRGIHKLSEEATQAYEGVRKKVRNFINAGSRREIIFTRGTTEGTNLVAQTWGRNFLKPGDVILSTVMEHHANIVPWQLLSEQIGVKVMYIPILPNGTLDLAAYERILRENPVKLVTVAHVSNVLGTINPVADMAVKAHDAGALILVDAAQSAPHLPLDVQAIDADFLVFSSHKMVGPTGIGVLYGKRDILEKMPPWMGGGDMIATVTLEGSTWNDLPYKFEAGTPSIAEAIGFGAAIDYLSAIGMDKIHAQEQQMTAYLLERLSEVPGVTVFGPEADKKSAVAAFVVEGAHAHDVAQLLDAEGIAVRAGHHCAMPLHTELGVSATSRASFYLYNTYDEVDVLIEALYTVQRTLR
ncbi:MAG: cysteine desulfurase [Anaerolineaceae bacterium]|nr:cysteine desulfurase [Anaerolineaceae bacterium]